MVHGDYCWPVCEAIHYYEVVSAGIRAEINGDFLERSVRSWLLNDWLFNIGGEIVLTHLASKNDIINVAVYAWPVYR